MKTYDLRKANHCRWEYDGRSGEVYADGRSVALYSEDVNEPYEEWADCETIEMDSWQKHHEGFRLLWRDNDTTAIFRGDMWQARDLSGVVIVFNIMGDTIFSVPYAKSGDVKAMKRSEFIKDYKYVPTLYERELKAIAEKEKKSRSVWVNVYRYSRGGEPYVGGAMFETKEHAIKCAMEDTNYVGTFPFTYEE